MYTTNFGATRAPSARRGHRRLATGRWLAVLTATVLVAAACGGDDGDDADSGSTDPSSSDAGEGESDGADSGSTNPSGSDAGDGDGDGDDAATPDDVDPDGILRLGATTEFPGGIHLDPAESVVNADRQWMELVFGTLLRHTADGTIEPWMAESYEIVDPQTVTLTLREGVTFSDGSPYDAEAVQAGLLRTLEEASEATQGGQTIAFKSISDVTIDDPQHVTITLSEPMAGELVADLADRSGVIVSPDQAASAPDQIDSEPIGAGPYTVERFDPQQIILTKNAEFFDTESWRIGGIEFVAVGDTSATLNGLQSGVLDFSNPSGTGVSTSDLARLESDDSFGTSVEYNDRGYVLLNMCTAKPPFDDPDIRHALQIAIDRDEVGELVFSGEGQPAYGLWPADHPYYDPEVEEIAGYDPDQAREIVEGAGGSVPVDIYVPAGTQTHTKVAEVLQAQLGEVGFDVTINPARDIISEFISPQKPGAMLIPGSRTGVDKYAKMFAEGQVQALCGQARPDVVEVLDPAMALGPDDEEAIPLFNEADLMVAENAYVVPIVFTPSVHTWSTDRVGGEPQFMATNSNLMMESIYIKQ